MPRGWLTPDFPPEHKFYTRRLQIPATAEFLGLVNGALIELCLPHNWEQSGEMTPFEAADYFTLMWEAYTHNEDEPPDWETPDDLDGQPEQPWYEDLSDWIIQGFLAITFTPTAAIVYQATVPKLRVAIRTGNLGALFRVLINGVELWTGDSYGAITDLLEHTFDMSAETEPYTVRIEHAGIGEGHGLTEAKLEVVRGEAVASMVATILRADPEGCGIQWSTDDGGTWDTIDLSECITTLANGAIGQAIDDGLLSRPGTQPPPESAPPSGECSSWHVSLQPGASWLCPIPVNYNDIVTISNAVGGWSIGELAWYCPDGKRYLLGACSEDGLSHQETDLLNPDAYHMELIGHIGDTYFPCLSAPHTITEVTVDSELTLTANTGLTGVPSGNIEFDVEVCKDAGWVYVMDITASQNGWSIVSSNGTWASGVGFESVFDGFYHQLHIQYNPLPDATYTEVDWDIYNSDTVTHTCNLTFEDPQNWLTANIVAGNSTIIYTGLIESGADARIQPFVLGSVTFRITEIVFKGTGVNPFI